MEFREQHIGQATVISIVGSIDALTAGEVTGFLSAQVQDGKRHLVADLSQVDFMSSAGLRTILATLKESRQGGGDLYIAAAQPGIEKILKMSGFTSILKSYPSVAEAVAGLGD